MHVNTYPTHIIRWVLRYAHGLCDVAKNYIFTQNTSHRIFAALSVLSCVIVTGLFVAYAFVMKTGMQTNFFYDETRYTFGDGGYPEILGYFFELFCVGVFLAYALAHKSYAWFAWMFIFYMTFIDDCFSVRDAIGHASVIQKGLSGATYEITGMLIIGPMILAIWSWGLYKILKDEKEFFSYLLFTVYFGALMFFGVFMDLFHGMVSEKYDVSETLLVLVEDGSELAILCLMGITALGMWCVNKHKLNWRQ